MNFLVTKQLSWDTLPEWEIAERKNGERVSPFFLSSETTLAFLGSHQHPFALAVCLVCLREEVPAAVWQEQHSEPVGIQPARGGVPASQGSGVVLFCMHVVAGALSRSLSERQTCYLSQKDLADGRCRAQMKTISWAAFCQH